MLVCVCCGFWCKWIAVANTLQLEIGNEPQEKVEPWVNNFAKLTTLNLKNGIGTTQGLQCNKDAWHTGNESELPKYCLPFCLTKDILQIFLLPSHGYSQEAQNLWWHSVGLWYETALNVAWSHWLPILHLTRMFHKLVFPPMVTVMKLRIGGTLIWDSFEYGSPTLSRPQG